MKIEPDPLQVSDNRFLCHACVKCEKAPPPAPPPMREGAMPHAHGVVVTLVVLVFLMGVVVGTKMAGGW
ncbi:hypothetical protein [Pseudomonas sp. p1(2021b)]|uniref:hypothetical protein n=1 Tax=Pseudomonas sp. p1(2021b) TaxID=2874628 RepID=UPI003D28BBC9